jgi:hypothetical protein
MLQNYILSKEKKNSAISIFAPQNENNRLIPNKKITRDYN